MTVVDVTITWVDTEVKIMMDFYAVKVKYQTDWCDDEHEMMIPFLPGSDKPKVGDIIQV